MLPDLARAVYGARRRERALRGVMNPAALKPWMPPATTDAPFASTPAAAPSALRELMRLAWPVVGLNVLNVLALIVDAIMCGHLENGEEALMALGFAGQILFLMVVIMMGITVGAVALVARAHGAGARERVQHLLQQSLQLTVLLGVVAGALGVAGSRPLLRMLGADDAVTEAGFGYLAPLMGATVFAYLNILLGAVLRGVGNTRLALFVAMVVNALNVLLNAALIFGLGPVPAFGLPGAAYGTIVAQIVGVLLSVALLRRGVEPALELRLGWAPLDLPLARELLRVGAPAALDMMILNAALFLIIALLGRADPLAVAAHGIGMRLQSLAFVPGLSIAQATGALVGQSLGAGNVERVRQVVRASSALSAGVLSALGVLIIVLAAPLIALFGAQPGSPLGELTWTWMSLLALGMPLVGAHFAFVGLFQGSGATNTGLTINALTVFFFQIPLSLVLGPLLGLGPLGIWIAFPASYALKLVLEVVAYRRDGWIKLGIHA
ncbi:MAG: MATE family efflux transporter [Polyangiales bacterium]|nr:MATE family efflux transporter [Myxococcales bacterium]MCB9656601.1 MATE family efflux transporter [Sandaracinaceae bacterium]